MNNDVKIYLIPSENLENVNIVEKMLNLITLNKVNLKKVFNVYEVDNLKQDGFAKLINCINTLKNDLKLDFLSIVVVPAFKDEFIKLINVNETNVYYLFDLLLKEKDNKNINVLKDIFNNVPDNILETVKTYINMNQSVIYTSEAMFTHRNTINYRINKFIYLTGIDVRETNNALVTYLMLKLLNI